MNDLEIANISEKPSLEYLIQKAILKVNGKNEASLCRFIPFKSGGYIHYFTLRKMKQQNPEKLYDLIQTHIIQPVNPQEIAVKSLELSPTYREKRLFTITETEMDRIITLAKQALDFELLKILQIKKDYYLDNKE